MIIKTSDNEKTGDEEKTGEKDDWGEKDGWDDMGEWGDKEKTGDKGDWGDWGEKSGKSGRELFVWATGDASVDEVGFLRKALAQVKADYQVTGPTVVLGFSNGAGLAVLAGCNGDLLRGKQDGTGILCAADNIATLWHEGADSLGTCEQHQPIFVAAGGTGNGWLAQCHEDESGALYDFWDLRNDRCGETDKRPYGGVEAWGPDFDDEDPVNCHHYSDCPVAGTYCLFPQARHEIMPTLTDRAWTALAGEASPDAPGTSAPASCAAVLALGLLAP